MAKLLVHLESLAPIAAALVTCGLGWRSLRASGRYQEALLAPLRLAIEELRKGHYIQASFSLVMHVEKRRRGIKVSPMADYALAYVLAAAGAKQESSLPRLGMKTGALSCLLRVREGDDAGLAQIALAPRCVKRILDGIHEPLLERHGVRVSALLFAFSLSRNALHVRGARERLTSLLRIASPQEHAEFDYLTTRWPELNSFIECHKGSFVVARGLPVARAI